jgi:hypothetical protein
MRQGIMEVEIEYEQQSRSYYATIYGDRFFVGRRAIYKGRIGLSNTKGAENELYDRNKFKEENGHWANIIHPTAMAESGFYHSLNTYDRARFTFGFLQYAAHVPDGDFVVFFRRILQLPKASLYFPDLRLIDNRITKVILGKQNSLETSESTLGLQSYLNPSAEIDTQEIENSAKLIHWLRHDPDFLKVQVDVAFDHIKKSMLTYSNQYDLHNALDVDCLLVADIRHQGRGDSKRIIKALKKSDRTASLLEIDKGKYPNRISVLNTEINRLILDKSLGKKKYDASRNEFL